MNYTVSKNQVQNRKMDGGMANPTFKPFYDWPIQYGDDDNGMTMTVSFFFVSVIAQTIVNTRWQLEYFKVCTVL